MFAISEADTGTGVAGVRQATLLMLGASASQAPAIRQARAAGLRVVAVDSDPAAVGFAEVDAAEAVDFSDLEAVVAVARHHRIEGVVAVSTDRAVPVAAAVAERLGLAGIGVETALVMTNKAAMRTRLREHGVPQPRFAVVGGQADAAAALAQIGVPAVLKPVDSAGQRGVFKVASQAELTSRLPDTLAQSRSATAILEKFVEGDELNTIAIVRGGVPSIVTISDRLRPPGLGFGVGWIHRFPSQQPAWVIERAAAVARAAIAALGLEDGIAYPQLLATPSGEVVVVEVAARIPAGQMSDLVRLGTGVDLFAVAFAQALGRPVSDDLVQARFERPIAIRFLTAQPGQLPLGRVMAVTGLERVRAAPGVLEAGLYLELGETIRPVQVDQDRRGYVIATGIDTDAALASANAAALELVVETVVVR